MSQDPGAQFAGAERAEFERVVEALSKSPRLARLLQYMGEKLFSGEADQLTEYNIATDVLGRSKKVFNAAEDAIARVETHRLRRRLAEFYETDGKDHPIQVTLPPGSYVPKFIRVSAPEEVASPSSNLIQTPESGFRSDRRPLWDWITENWKYSVFAVSVVIVALGAYLYLRAGSPSIGAKPRTDSTGATAPVPLQPAVSSLPIRLLAGYSGPPRTDSAGRIWKPDQYFSGGASWRRAPGFMARTSDQFLFDHSRTGDFTYSIPLEAGSYELHLFFSTPVQAAESIFTFNIAINGKYVVEAFDINADALGANIADERVFRDVSPDKDGYLRISFSGGTGPPSLNALEILPGLPHTQLPIRLIMQTAPVTDHTDRVWHPDDYFMNGRLSTETHPLKDSPDPDLFSGERYGHFTYAIPVDTRGRYTLVLHFAEFYFGSGAPGNGGEGSRIFKVMCNGETLLDNFDIFKEAGSLREVAKTFRHLKPTAQGKLNLTFEPVVNNATISGIEVLDESE